MTDDTNNLGNDMADIIEVLKKIREAVLDRLPKKQTIHDINKQILRRTELKPGKYKLCCTGYDITAVVEVLSDPVQDEHGTWYVDVKYASGEINQHLLAHMGIVPYYNGSWHNKNYLIREE